MASKEASLLLRIKTAGEEAISRVGDSFKDLGKIVTGVYGLLTAFVAKSISEFREQEEAQNSLTRAMVNSGVYTKQLADNYNDQSKAIQKLTIFSGDQITAAQAALQQQIGSTKITKELTMAIADFATKQKVDLASAADTVGKSIGGTTNALARYGIEIKSNATEAEKMAAAIEGLNHKFGGQAIAAAQGLGSLEKFKNKVADVFEDFGGRLAPAVQVGADILWKFIERTMTGTAALEGFASVVQWVANISIRLMEGVELLGSTIGIGLAAAIEAASMAMKGNFKGALDVVKLGFTEVENAAVESTTRRNENLSKLEEAFLAKKTENKTKELNLEQQAADNKTAIDAENAAKDWNQKQARRDEQHALEMAWIGATDEQKLQAASDHFAKMAELETNAINKSMLLKNKEAVDRALLAAKTAKAEEDLAQKTAQAKVNIASSAANLIAAVSEEGSKVAFLAQKAAGIAQAIVATNVAAAQALAVPPAPNVALAGYAKAAGYMNVAAIGATAIKGLATGGVVQARQGGTPFILGEGGQDEAVIPLDKAGGIGGGVTLNVYGGLLGDASSAREFALAVDKELLNLRRNNESQAFDSGVV